MKHLLVILVLLLAFDGCSKKSIQDIERFDPDFHIGDFQNVGITNGKEEISCKQVEFNDYACMHIDKVKELSTILSRYRRRVPITSKKVDNLIKDIQLLKEELPEDLDQYIKENQDDVQDQNR